MKVWLLVLCGMGGRMPIGVYSTEDKARAMAQQYDWCDVDIEEHELDASPDGGIGR